MMPLPPFSVYRRRRHFIALRIFRLAADFRQVLFRRRDIISSPMFSAAAVSFSDTPISGDFQVFRFSYFTPIYFLHTFHSFHFRRFFIYFRGFFCAR